MLPKRKAFNNKALALKIIFLQFVLSAIISVSYLLFHGSDVRAGLSAAIGGSITIIPNFIFMLVFLKGYTRSASKAVHYFYLGEIFKILMLVGLFTLALQWSKLKVGPLFFCFVITQLVYGAVPFLGANTFKGSA